jgi:hypothetical protein
MCDGGLPGFISDPQEYTINPKENSVYDVIFYTGFTYRIKLCTKNTPAKLEFNLVDEKGNTQFTKNIEAGFFRDFEFDTLFHGKIIIKPLDSSIKEAQLLIGYKKKKKEN